MFSITYELNLMRSHGNDYKNLYNPVSNKGDSGVDIYIPTEITIPGKTTTRIPLGVHCSVIKKTSLSIPGSTSTLTLEPSSFFLLPRSSISKTPLRLSNSIGLIDSGYRGAVQAPVDNISDEEYSVKEGTRLFQIVSPDLQPFSKINIVDELSETQRGEGGFGSTGK